MIIGLLGFSESLARRVNTSNYTKCTSLNNHRCMTEPTFTNLHPNEYSQGLRYYPFAFNLDRCMGSVILLIIYPTNLRVFNMITGINESKTLTKHISCEFKRKSDGRKCNSHKKWNNDKCWCLCKNCEKHSIWNLTICSCENGKYIESTIDDSIIT